MRALGRFIVVMCAAIGGLIGSQFPEFAQQYRQRIGGALQELDTIVEQFDADAERNRLTRQAALETYQRSPDTFLRDRGISMASTLARYENLFEQKVRLEAAPPVMRPVVLLSHPDGELIQGAWTDFEPGVPVTVAGFVWAALGFFLFGGLVSLLRQLFGIARKGVTRARPA